MAADERNEERTDAGADRALDLASTLYRDEMRRAMTWRMRLDRTTNWSVILAATLLTWSFSGTDRPHFVLVVAIGMLTVFLLIEARRYRFYDVFRARLRLLEANAFAPVFDEEVGGDGEDWRYLLAEDFRQPALKMPWLEAVRRRLRRVYGALFLLLGVAWCLRMSTIAAEEGFPEAAHIDAVPGWAVLATLAAFYLALLLLVLLPLPREARGELREQEEGDEGWG